MKTLEYQPTHVPGMQDGELAFTIRQANEDGTEHDMFNVRVGPSNGATGMRIVRRLDHCSREIAAVPCSDNATLDELLRDAGAKLCAEALVTGAGTTGDAPAE